jgi:hypothetical protein
MDTSNTPTIMNPTPSTSTTVRENEGNAWVSELIRLACAVLVAVIGLVSYHYLVHERSKPRFAVVDISQVLQLKELQVMVSVGQPGGVEKAGGDVFEEISKFATSIETAISAIKEECGCMLLVKAAVIKPEGAQDLTPLLKQRLGLANVDEASLLQQIRMSGIGGGMPPGMQMPLLPQVADLPR